MLDYLKENWQIFVTTGGAVLAILNGYKTLLDIVHLRKQIHVLNIQVSEIKSEASENPQELIKSKEHEANTLKKNLSVTSIIMITLVFVSITLFEERQELNQSNQQFTNLLMINQESGLSKPPLIFAAEQGYTEIVKTLLVNGANVNAKDDSGRTALTVAAKKGYSKIAHLLLEYGANLNTKDRSNNTPLEYAANVGHMEIVKLLLESGASMRVSDTLAALASKDPPIANKEKYKIKVSVNLDRSGANVFVDGLLVGIAPTVLQVSPGSHQLKVIYDSPTKDYSSVYIDSIFIKEDTIIRIRSSQFKITRKEN